jgi:hypothetical protein
MADEDRYSRTDLINLAGGAITEKFDRALKELMTNIDDINTDAKAERSITIKVKFKPDPSRKTIAYKATVESKLAAALADEDVIFVVHDKDGPVAVNDNLRQMPMFDKN